MTANSDKRIDVWERHIRTVTGGVAVLLLAWLASTSVQMSNDLAAIKVQLPAFIKVGERVNVLSERMALVEFQLYNNEDKK